MNHSVSGRNRTWFLPVLVCKVMHLGHRVGNIGIEGGGWA